MSVTLVIPRHPPAGANALHRAHWAARGRERKLWHAEVRAAWLAARRPRFRGPVAVTLRLYYPANRRRDPDNAVAGAKGIIDGLVLCGCIPEDNARAMELRPVQMLVDRQRPRVEIDICGVEEGA